MDRDLLAAGTALIIAVALSAAVGGCDPPSSEEMVEEPTIEQTWWEADEEEGYYYGPAATDAANTICERHGGVRELVREEEDGALEYVICEDGHTGSPYELE
jgi:hypothetical protein